MVLGAIVPEWAGFAGILVAIATGLGAVVAIFKANMAMATIVLLEANNGALTQTNEMQQLQLDKQDATIDGLKKQGAAQQGQIDTLKELASGKKAVDELALVLADRHAQLMAALGGGRIP
jgi:hypothetical protein